jgi:ribosomal protein S18 acetylase RimI-like enzyme
LTVLVRRVEDASDPAIDQVVRLGKRNAKYLGFMPKGGYLDRVEKGTLLVSMLDDAVVGYLLYDLPRSVIHVAHLCVDSSARRQGVARRLVEEVSARHRDRRGIELLVRNDFPAFDMWYGLGFTPDREVAGRGAAGLPKTLMWLDHGEHDLFSWAEDPAVAVTAVVDASVFYDLHALPGRAAHLATPELADAIANGELELVIAPELIREISRHDVPGTRKRLRDAASTYRRLAASTEAIARIAALLESEVSDSDRRKLSDRDLADLRYGAAAVASGVQYVLTKDDRFLRWVQAPLRARGVSVLNPRAALVRVDEVARSASYSPRALHGTALSRARVGAANVARLRDAFLNRESGERRSAFDRLVQQVLGAPTTSSELILNGESLLALWSTRVDGDDLVVDLLRVDGTASLAATLAEQLEFMLRDVARRERASRLLVIDPHPSTPFHTPMRRDGFIEVPAGIAAPTPARCIGRAGWGRHLRRESTARGSAQLVDVTRLCTQRREPTPAETSEFERRLWPAKMLDGPLPTFLVPIRQLWSSRLFGTPTSLEVRPTVLGLSREHVYYRAPTPGVVRAPGRVLWYATQGRHEPTPPGVFACSRLDEVVVDAPDILHARFKHLGVYDRSNVVESARDGRAQAIRVADTELFDEPVGLDRLRVLAEDFCQTLHLRSPQSLSPELFGAIYSEGVSGHGGWRGGRTSVG